MIEQGAEFRLRFLVQATDLTGYTAEMQIRDTVDAATVRIDLSTETTGLTITPLIDGSADSAIDIHITDEVTTLYKQATGVYDIKLHPPSGEDWRLMQGKIKNSFEVTR